MRDEVSMLVLFVVEQLLSAAQLSPELARKLTEQLTRALYAKYTSHWHPRNALVSRCPGPVSSLEPYPPSSDSAVPHKYGPRQGGGGSKPAPGTRHPTRRPGGGV